MENFKSQLTMCSLDTETQKRSPRQVTELEQAGQTSSLRGTSRLVLKYLIFYHKMYTCVSSRNNFSINKPIYHKVARNK
jgi:hypothetical protein